MHLRLFEIRKEIEILENPVFRKIYEDVHFNKKLVNNNKNLSVEQKPSIYIVTKKDSLPKQMEYLEAAKALIGNDDPVNMLPSLKVCDHLYCYHLHVFESKNGFLCYFI